jgi:hypothetical protein
VKAVARQIEIRRALRFIQVTENIRNSAGVIRADLARVPFV